MNARAAVELSLRVLCATALGLVAACSGGASGTDIPSYQASASSGAPESASPAATGTASATASPLAVESVSTEKYTLVTAPKGLARMEASMLEGFVAADKLTWDLWFERPGVDKAEEAASGTALEEIKEDYAQWEGVTLEGNVRVAIDRVEITRSDGLPAGEVSYCVDQSGLTARDASGKDVSESKGLDGRFGYIATLEFQDGTWRIISVEYVSLNECAV